MSPATPRSLLPPYRKSLADPNTGSAPFQAPPIAAPPLPKTGTPPPLPSLGLGHTGFVAAADTRPLPQAGPGVVVQNRVRVDITGKTRRLRFFPNKAHAVFPVCSLVSPARLRMSKNQNPTFAQTCHTGNEKSECEIYCFIEYSSAC